MSSSVLLMTVSSCHQDWLPYPVACLISYVKNDPYVEKNYEFVTPEWRAQCTSDKNFWNQLESVDILGLSCYVWNQVVNDQIAKKYKEINPNGIVLFGGPNIPENFEELDNFTEKRPWVNHYFVGPGEKSFLEFLKSENSKKIYFGKPLGKNDYSPRPYLDGTLEPCIQSNEYVAAPIETNRGCPYGCAFCDWGGQARSRIVPVDEEVVKQSIDKVLDHKNLVRLEILDANYGMFARDVEFIEYIIKGKNQRNREILLTFAGFAKNGSKHLNKILSLSLDHFPDLYRNIKLSFQTLTPKVLDNIQRQNIKTENLIKATEGIDSVQLNSEIIIGLPGETPKSYLDSICKHIDMGIDFVRSYPLYILPNTPMNTREYKSKLNIKTKRLYLPSDLAMYGENDFYDNIESAQKIVTKFDQSDEFSFETFEMISSCESYDSAQLVQMYDYWFWFNTLYNSGIARDAIKKSQLSPADQAQRFFSQLDRMPFIHGLVNENRKCCMETVANSDEITVVSNLKNYYWLHIGLGRGAELVHIYRNQEIFERELKTIYPDFQLDKFREFDSKKLPFLLSCFAQV